MCLQGRRRVLDFASMARLMGYLRVSDNCCLGELRCHCAGPAFPFVAARSCLLISRLDLFVDVEGRW